MSLIIAALCCPSVPKCVGELGISTFFLVLSPTRQVPRAYTYVIVSLIVTIKFLSIRSVRKISKFSVFFCVVAETYNALTAVFVVHKLVAMLCLEGLKNVKHENSVQHLP